MNPTSWIGLIVLGMAMMVGGSGLAAPVATTALWEANGPVDSTALSPDGKTLYLGGSFSYVGPHSGAATVLEADGQFQAASSLLEGKVYSVAADSSGGWYVGGDFSIAGAARNLVHIDQTGVLLPWSPVASQPVNVVRYVGGQLFVGSDTALTEYNTTTGAAVWTVASNGRVLALAVSGASLYVGGEFTTLGGSSRSHLARVDVSAAPATITVDPAWQPVLGSALSVRALAIDSLGGWIYAAGSFTVGGGARTNITRVDAATGVIDSWGASCSGGAVYDLALASSSIFVAGEFTSCGGSGAYLAELNAAGAQTIWSPQPDAPVHALALSAGGTALYAGGVFRQMTAAGLLRHHLAGFLISDGMVQLEPGWQQMVGGDVRALSAVNGPRLFIGGDFTSAGGVARNNLAALDVESISPTFGKASLWNPSANAAVHVVRVEPSTGSIYVGGEFSSIGSAFRTGVAALKPVTGVAYSEWNARFNAGAKVYALELSSRGTVLAGGLFTSVVGSATRNNLVEISLIGARIETLMMDIQGGAVRTLQILEGRVFVGGDFTAISGKPRNHLAAVSITTLRLEDWQLDCDGPVYALRLTADGKALLVGGDFTQVGTVARRYLARVDPLSPAVASWNAEVDGGPVTTMTISADRSILYLGGTFTTIHSSAYPSLAALYLANTTPLIWNPIVNGAVNDLRLSNDGSKLYVAGAYSRMDVNRSHIVETTTFPSETTPPLTTASLADNVAYNGITIRPVELVCDDGIGSGCAATYYTLDGTDPDPATSPEYVDAITLRSPTTLKFLSVDYAGNTESSINQRVYTIEADAPLTTASPETRTFNDKQLVVTLSCRDDSSGCAATYYTTDGSKPTTASTRYTGPLILTQTTLLRFFSVDQAGNVEAPKRENYISNRGGFGAVGGQLLLGLLVMVVWRQSRPMVLR
ncbi:MAG: chitobiase/beta-hexosaminidase C-terminal domain-containing protein [Gammaproteobacteria bacterium]|nr:chitobiase/beta-hexosaminidase C-terminal domain-containing protein [Gammaproteobacteria bacterium]